jgi:hypothetical protein
VYRMHFLSAVDEGCVVSPSGTHREVFITCSRALLSIGGQLTLSQGLQIAVPPLAECVKVAKEL